MLPVVTDSVLVFEIIWSHDKQGCGGGARRHHSRVGFNGRAPPDRGSELHQIEGLVELHQIEGVVELHQIEGLVELHQIEGVVELHQIEGLVELPQIEGLSSPR